MCCTYGTGKETGLLINASELSTDKHLIYLTIE